MSNKIKQFKKQKAQEEEIPSLIEQLTAFNVLQKFDHLLDQGWFIDPDSRKMTCRQGLDHKREWMFVNPDHEMSCNLYQEIFKICNFIPERCRGCWKVVVKMHTVRQLFDLWQWQIKWTKGFEHKGRYCKCGPEKRLWVRENYGAYFYTSSQAEGQTRKREVVEELTKLFGLGSTGKYDDGKIGISLKRGCTEMELGLGPSTEYVKTKFDLYREARILDFIDRPKINPILPREVEEFVLLKWFKYAWKINDMTVKEFYGGKDLYGSCITY